MVGYSLTIYGVAMIIVQTFVLRLAISRLGESKTVLAGLSISALSFVFMASITNGWVVLALTPIAALGTITGPALMQIMSTSAADNQQGELQGLLASIGSIATILSPLLMTRTFSYFISDNAPAYLPGAPFILSTGFMLICIVIYTGSKNR